MSREPENPDVLKPEHYKHWTTESVRYSDTDRQGHVNNAVFATYLEAGRVALLYGAKKASPPPPGTSFALVNLLLAYRAEILWPGEVSIGTTCVRVGSSSVDFDQALFVGGACVATAQTVLVLMDNATRKSRPLPDETRRALLE